LEELIPGEEEPARPCDGMYETYDPDRSPFALRGGDTALIDCFSELSPGVRMFPDSPPAWEGERPGSAESVSFPFLISAIDPEQEARLVELDETVVSGRFLEQGEDPVPPPAGCFCIPALPVIVSTDTYVDQSLRFEIERLQIPEGADVPEVLSSEEAREFVSGLPGETVASEDILPDAMYERLLDGLSTGTSENPIAGYFMDKYWTVSPTEYESTGENTLRATTAENPISVWESARYPDTGYQPAPPGNEDVQFRDLTPYEPVTETEGSMQGLLQGGVEVVGRFDPDLLPGFSKLSEVPLESYYPPTAEPADEASREALGGNPLRPTMNLGDYLSQPPFMLTNLNAYRQLIESGDLPEGNTEAPISVIRVRVAGVEGADPASLERIRRVAQQIQTETGLAVDITAGSSPTPINVELPAGDYGRPELTVEEGWVQKGVAVEVLTGVDKKSATLFGLVLLVCGFFLANGAFASVRARRREFGVLMSLGWSRSGILAAVLGELALIGLVAGALGTLLAAALVELFALELPLWRTILVAPVSVLLAVAAGLIPALLASRGSPLDAVRSPVSSLRSGGSVRSVAAMAATNLRRLPGRTMLGAMGLVVGVSALTVLLGVNLTFYDTLVGTVLGDFLATQVRPVDYLSVALAMLLGGFSVADVLYLNLRERAPELVTLRTCGWEERHLMMLGLFEGLGMGMLGGLCGGALGLLVLGVLGGAVSSLVLGLAALAALGGVFVAVLASLVPLIALSRLTPPTVLAEDS
jgi:putative ABC transport system permease protein